MTVPSVESAACTETKIVSRAPKEKMEGQNRWSIGGTIRTRSCRRLSHRR
jgi:hypothetical protein